MKKMIFWFYGILCCIATHAQDTSVNAAARDLYETIRRMPSFREQVTGDTAARYDSVYQRVLNAKLIRGSFEEFYTLSQLLLPFRDNHLVFTQSPQIVKNNGQSEPRYTRPAAASGGHLNADSLARKLRKKSVDSVEGLYYSHGLEMGLFRTLKKDSLVGVVTSSSRPYWQPGDIAIILKEFRPGNFRAWYADSVSRNFSLFKNERFVNRMLAETGWRKLKGGEQFWSIPKNESLFQFRVLNDSTQYLRLGSFDASTFNITRLNLFLDSVKNLITAPHLVVDLRNNGGGGFRASGHFLRLLLKYAESHKISALINQRTFSNAEQFAIRLRSSPNVTLLGQITNGTLTYGNNTGERKYIAGGLYSLYITDMKDSGGYLPYEEYGVRPDVFLDQDSDWIQQTIKYATRKP